MGARFQLSDLPPALQKQVAEQLYPSGGGALASNSAQAGTGGAKRAKTAPRRLAPKKALEIGLFGSVREFRFHPTRLWRFDHAWPAEKVALEVEGGAWANGRHNRASGFIADMEKYSEAAADGWLVLRVLPDQLRSQKTADLIARARAQGPRASSVTLTPKETRRKVL
jgi:hypothetical protein